MPPKPSTGASKSTKGKESSKSAGKTKNVPPSLLAMKAQIEKQKQAEAKRMAEEEADQKRVEEEEKRIALEEQKKEEERKRKKAAAKTITSADRKLLEKQKKLEELRHAGHFIPKVADEENGNDSGGKMQRSNMRQLYSSRRKTNVSKPSAPPRCENEDEKIKSRASNLESRGSENVGLENEVGPQNLDSLYKDFETIVDRGDRDLFHDASVESDVCASWEDYLEHSERLAARRVLATLHPEVGVIRIAVNEEQAKEWKSLIQKHEKSLENISAKVSRTQLPSSNVPLKNDVIIHPTSLRSPIICILGHVDAGKTSLLDCLRRSKVQSGEAGGITQQIGATFFPIEHVVRRTASLIEANKFRGADSKKALMPSESKLPGFLMIDTPGHSCFTHLRSRGSSLCDIAILLVDLTKGLEAQTKESLDLLRRRKCPFIVVINKVDRMYDWVPTLDAPFSVCLSKQKKYVHSEFLSRVQTVKTQLMEEGFNSELFYENTDLRKTVSLVPVSATTGEGIPDLLCLLTQIVENFMESKVTLHEKGSVDCTLLEVKKTEGFGTTLDVILVNGALHIGDTIVVCGLNGPIVTTIRNLLSPAPCTELRLRGDFVTHQSVHAAKGVKIAAHDIEDAVAGTPLFVYNDKDPSPSLEDLKSDVMKDVTSLNSRLEASGRGITLQASTLGSLEALLSFFEEKKVPVACIALGPIHKRHMIHCQVSLERDPKNALLLAFDVPISKEAQEIADFHKIPIFSSNVIYTLFDRYIAYVKQKEEQAKDRNQNLVVFPVSFRYLQTFRAADPIVLGVEVLRGQLRSGTPIGILPKNNADSSTNSLSPSFQTIGTVVSVQSEHKEIPISRAGSKVAIKIQTKDLGAVVGRHVPTDCIFHSALSRKSIDALKESFRGDMADDDWRLVVELKRMQSVL